ncbi:hypothetical protein M413DRAFT_25830 [Hebeloma cylindrosporum]|uniref:EF-hand domain-containing protein n=1 Tax=Hebeloma cylindrosporum TaxID=76867 RepID=A0A0C2Y0S5_HEBCY|nr:hypothetical protein M413DRAFT_25830 [Hebeloma cylindrosporum h7]
MSGDKAGGDGKGVGGEHEEGPTAKCSYRDNGESSKYQPYDALRQWFWRQYLKQYDTNDTNALSNLELTSMLDSLGSTLLGSTLAQSTMASFFTRDGKKPL